MTLDDKLKQLRHFTHSLPFTEMSADEIEVYKINNPFTKYGQFRLTLTPVKEGFERAIERAIEVLTLEEERYEANCT